MVRDDLLAMTNVSLKYGCERQLTPYQALASGGRLTPTHYTPRWEERNRRRKSATLVSEDMWGGTEG